MTFDKYIPSHVSSAISRANLAWEQSQKALQDHLLKEIEKELGCSYHSLEKVGSCNRTDGVYYYHEGSDSYFYLLVELRGMSFKEGFDYRIVSKKLQAKEIKYLGLDVKS